MTEREHRTSSEGVKDNVRDELAEAAGDRKEAAPEEERNAHTDKFTEVEDRYAGYIVYDQHYEKLGNVDDLFVDENDSPQYIGVKMGFLGTRSTLIPCQMARVNDARQTIKVAADKQTLKNGPTFDDDREITPQLENEVYSYYGLQRASTIEQSGTYAAHTAEQSTQTTGHIKEAGGTKDNLRDELDEAAGRGRRKRDDRKEAPEEVGQPAPGESRRMSETSGPSRKGVASRK